MIPTKPEDLSRPLSLVPPPVTGKKTPGTVIPVTTGPLCPFYGTYARADTRREFDASATIPSLVPGYRPCVKKSLMLSYMSSFVFTREVTRFSSSPSRSRNTLMK